MTFLYYPDQLYFKSGLKRCNKLMAISQEKTLDPGLRRERVGNSDRMRFAHAAVITCR
jgi:hypothetical protein